MKNIKNKEIEPYNNIYLGMHATFSSSAEMLTLKSDMEFVKNFAHPDFQAKSFTPQKCVICDSFFGN